MKHFSLSQQWILFVLALFALGLLSYRFYYAPVPSLPEKPAQEVVIEVGGDVRTPGLQIFRGAPTLRLVLEKAGGFNNGLLRDTASLSAPLDSGTLVTVVNESPSKASGAEIQVKLDRMEAKKLLVFSIPLNLNRVSAEDLCLVPGIGNPLALEIVRYRERRKGFRSVEELKNIKGVGEKNWQAFRPYFTVK
jgi:competence protein ComEA